MVIYIAKIGSCDYVWNDCRIVGAATTEEGAREIIKEHIKPGLHGYIKKVEVKDYDSKSEDA